MSVPHFGVEFRVDAQFAFCRVNRKGAFRVDGRIDVVFLFIIFLLLLFLIFIIFLISLLFILVLRFIIFIIFIIFIRFIICPSS